MTPAIAILVISGILLVSGWKNKSIADTALGRDSTLPGGGVPSDSDGAAPGMSPLGDGTVTGEVAPSEGLGHFDGQKVAKWIIPELKWLRRHGWKGTVTSGYRTTAEQAAVKSTYGPKAVPGTSEHEQFVYPHGAVDLSDWQTASRLAIFYPGPQKLIWLGLSDPVHFSGTGH